MFKELFTLEAAVCGIRFSFSPKVELLPVIPEPVPIPEEAFKWRKIESEFSLYVYSDHAMKLPYVAWKKMVP
jgi:hypothetical protein